MLSEMGQTEKDRYGKMYSESKNHQIHRNREQGAGWWPEAGGWTSGQRAVGAPTSRSKMSRFWCLDAQCGDDSKPYCATMDLEVAKGRDRKCDDYPKMVRMAVPTVPPGLIGGHFATSLRVKLSQRPPETYMSHVNCISIKLEKTNEKKKVCARGYLIMAEFLPCTVSGAVGLVGAWRPH